jgi:type I restriction enzyme M protein
MSDVVQKLWGFCHTLRHDGIDYVDYIEQLTYLLFLKMADERGIDLSKNHVTTEKGEERTVDCSWPGLEAKSGTGLTEHYIDVLRALGQQKGLLGDIFTQAQSRFNNPVNLKKLIGLIDETEWTSLDIDVKAAAFEGLLEKAASEGKKGAGQYFTPRILIQSIVRCVKPDPRAHREFTVCDPACGTGGFLVASYEWLIEQTRGGALDRELAKRIKQGTYFGEDLVPRPRRLALMNLYLHGLEPDIKLGDSIYEVPDRRRYDVVLTNPPFGTKGANQVPEREDFVISTSNKQLNFIQHVMTILKPGGRAAVVVPDNCLFADQAGDVFKVLTEDCELHTVLRLPNGTFSPYSPGTKTNVIFFTKGYPTENVWIYDARSNVPRITKKDRPLSPEHFAEFEACFGSDFNGRSKRDTADSKENRWRCFHISEIKERDFKIDSLKWLRDESLDDGDELPEPEELAADAIAELESAVEELNSVIALLQNGNESALPGQDEETSRTRGA